MSTCVIVKCAIIGRYHLSHIGIFSDLKDMQLAMNCITLASTCIYTCMLYIGAHTNIYTILFRVYVF